MPRAAAALVALACWAGLTIQFSVTYSAQHDVGLTLWVLVRFFTILTNLLVAVAMTWVAVGGRVSALVLGGLLLALALVGTVYALLLARLYHLTGPALIGDRLMHRVSPVLMALWWLFFAPRAKLRWSAPLWWCVYPLAYFGYVLVRAHFDGKYPYPFIDLAKLGSLQTALNAGGIAATFILAGFLVVWIDSWRPLGSRRSSR
jgi:hypothetical protein